MGCWLWGNRVSRILTLKFASISLNTLIFPLRAAHTRLGEKQEREKRKEDGDTVDNN